MINSDIQTLAIKLAQTITFLTGVFLITYNLFSFKVAKNGYYFNDDNQMWLAYGVLSLAITYVIKNWNKI